LEIRTSELPEISQTRILAALKKPPQGTFVISDSKLKWAYLGLIASLLGIWGLIAEADSYKWQADERLGYLLLATTCFVAGQHAVMYLISWFRAKFKPQVLINPLYFLRFRFRRIEAIAFTGQKVWSVEHLKDSKGAYVGTRFHFRPATGAEKILKVTSVRTANDLIEALNSFPDYVSGLVQNQDRNTLYFYDLLYEWRLQTGNRSQVQGSEVAGLAFVLRKLGPSLAAALLGILAFFVAVVPYNDYRDDEIRWESAKSSASASGYRLYVASRPDGRHLSDARAAIAALYVRATDRYRSASGGASSQGVEVVIKMLEYARSSGRYKVFVSFRANNEIPGDVEARLRKATGFRILSQSFLRSRPQ
jgi:hypothetical protein